MTPEARARKTARAKVARQLRLEHYRKMEREKQQRLRAKNPEKAKAYTRAYRAANPEKTQEWWHRTYAKNGDTIRERSRLYRQEHSEQISVYLREWRKRNPDLYDAYTRQRRALQRGASISDFTETQWERMKDAYGHRCAYCGEQSDVLHRDHVIPLSRGGDHTEANIVPACPPCNLSKHAKDAPPFAIDQLQLVA